MAEPESKAPESKDQDPNDQNSAAESTFGDRLHGWFVTEGAWYTASFVFHAFLAGLLMLFGAGAIGRMDGDAPSIEEAQADAKKLSENLEKFEVGETPIEPTELNTDTLMLNQAPSIDQTEQINDNNPIFSAAGGGSTASATGPQLGGLGGFDFKAVGPGAAVRGKGGVGFGTGTGGAGTGGGSGTGFGGRGTGMRKAMVGSFGGTKQSERAVAAALNWLARHQGPDGSWSLENYTRKCKDASCAGAGNSQSDPAATAVALLPFLAAGQTHESRGPYKTNIYQGLYWLMKNQRPDGDLSGGKSHRMYAHGLAAIAMCEAYGLTNDRALGQSAQRAINFIQSAQHPTSGGWRYNPGDEGDTSVVGWQLMALKSAQMAYLNVNPKAFEGAKHWLQSVAKGKYKGTYAYRPEAGATPAMSAVGLLCQQYMGMKPGDPALLEGEAYLMGHLPDARSRALYFWYYATQVMHNIPGPDWDKWNRQMRRVLIDSQIKEGCAAGSWDPMRPTRDPLGERGGRVLVTGLSTLTLEVYYRYLPLYKLDAESKNPEAVKAVQGDPKAAAKWSSEGEKTVKEDAKDAGKGKKDDAKKPAPKKDEPKKDGPKKDEPKKEATKPDEPKKGTKEQKKPQ